MLGPSGMVHRPNPIASTLPDAVTPRQISGADNLCVNSPQAISHETLERLKAYCALVGKWNKSINLVSKNDQNVIWSRHVLDSLRLLSHIPKGTEHGIDLGSGGGFPGLVLALATGITFDLIESDHRKASFLVEAQRMTNAPVRVHCARIESIDLPPAPLVTARALAPLTTLFAYAHRFLIPEGIALFLKGARASQEIADAAQQWHMQINRFDDAKHSGSTILMISNLSHA